MQQVPLNAVPSQNLSIQLDGEYWFLEFFLSMEFVCVSISRDGEPLISGMRCFVNQPLLPYSYMYEPKFGNFLFDNEVDWQDFNGSCSLYYLNASEFAEYKQLVKQGYEQSAIKMIKSRADKFVAEASKIDNTLNLTQATITQQPIDITVQEGSDIQFECTADDWVSIAWEYSPQKDNVSWRAIQEITGGLAEKLSIKGVTKYNNGFYRAVVFGDNNTVTSDIVELKVV